MDTQTYFDDIKLADDFIQQRRYLKFPVSTLDADYAAIKYGIKIKRHNFPKEWMTKEPWQQGGYQQRDSLYQGAGMSGGGGGYQPQVPLTGTTPKTPYSWRPASFVDERHPKIQTMMEPFLVRFRGRCSVSNILTASGKRFEDLPKLEEYPGGVCWLHSLGLCPYGDQCSFIAGHVAKGTFTDAIADQVVGTLQAGIASLMARPEGGGSPSGKRKYRRGAGRGGGRLSPPPSGTTPM